MDNKWHYTENNEYPVVFGKYKNQQYQQIPCLVEYVGFFGIRYWNVNQQCWDDEEADDYFCDKDSIIRWRYLDAILDEK